MSDGKMDDGVETPYDDVLAQLAMFVLAGRPERIEDGMLALAPGPFREGVRATRAALVMLAFVEPPSAPCASLRDRLLATISARSVRRALVIIDMINDHLEAGALLEVARARDVVPALKQRIASARANGIPIVYVVDEHDADDPDLDAWGAHAIKGTRGVEIWNELAPESGDRIVKKPSFSAFFETELAIVLDELKVDTLVLAGCLTEIGIMATATDAMQLGYAVEVPPDSQAGSCAEAEMAAMGTMRVMAPFGRARKKRLAELTPLAA